VLGLDLMLGEKRRRHKYLINSVMKNIIVILICFVSPSGFSKNDVDAVINTEGTFSGLKENFGNAANTLGFNVLFGGTKKYSLSHYSYLDLKIDRENKSVKANDLIDITENKVLGKKDLFLNASVFLAVFLKENTKINRGSKAFDIVNQYGDELYLKIDYGLTFGIYKSIKTNESNLLNLEFKNYLMCDKSSCVDPRNNGDVRTNSVNLIRNCEFN
jgi:hypothetical protein